MSERLDTAQQLSEQSIRLEQAVEALRAVSGMAGAIKAREGAPGSSSGQLPNLAGLLATIATAVEIPLRGLDGVIDQLEGRPGPGRQSAGCGTHPQRSECPNDAI